MNKENNNGFFISTLKGTGISVFCVVICTLIFAVVVKNAGLNSTVIRAVNQFIKAVSIFIGCLFTLKENKGILKGGTVGLLAVAVCYLLFALTGDGVTFGKNFALDLCFGLIIGIISGIIAVNVKGR